VTPTFPLFSFAEDLEMNGRRIHLISTTPNQQTLWRNEKMKREEIPSVERNN
jgi:hypothetical protein